MKRNARRTIAHPMAWAFAALLLILLPCAGAVGDIRPWTLDWTSAAGAQSSERLLSRVQSAMDDAVRRAPSPSMHYVQDILIRMRTEHRHFGRQESSALRTWRSAYELRTQMQQNQAGRQQSVEWLQMDAASRQQVLNSEATEIANIEQSIQSARSVYRQANTQRLRREEVLRRYVDTWGPLLLEQRLSGTQHPLSTHVLTSTWTREAETFAASVYRDFADCRFPAPPSPTTSSPSAPSVGSPYSNHYPNTVTRQPAPRTAAAPGPLSRVLPTPTSRPGITRPGTPSVISQPVVPKTPAPVAYPPAVTAPQPVVRQPAAPRVAGGVQWYHDWNQASAAARAMGGVVFMMASRATCTQCHKVKDTVIPRHQNILGGRCVGFVFDMSQKVGGVYGGRYGAFLRRNLPYAQIMPLAGFVTPDMQWIDGFWGMPTDADFAQKARTAVARAR